MLAFMVEAKEAVDYGFFAPVSREFVPTFRVSERGQSPFRHSAL